MASKNAPPTSVQDEESQAKASNDVTTTLPKPPTEASERTEMARTATIRTRLGAFMDNPEKSLPGRIYHNFFLVLIVLNLIGLMLETLDGPNHGSSAPEYAMLPYSKSFVVAEMIFTAIVSLDLIVKFAVSKSVKKHFVSAVTIMDILAAAPLYILVLQSGLVALDNSQVQKKSDDYIKLLRLFRITRVVNMLKHKTGMRVLYITAKDCLAPLSITLFFLVTFVMLFGAILFYAQPCYNVSTCTFTDIFNAGYFVMVTVATVGYGDQMPDISNVIVLVVAIIVMIFGALYLAMPLAIVGIKYELTWAQFAAAEKTKVLAKPPSDPNVILTSELLAPTASRINVYYMELCQAASQLWSASVHFDAVMNSDAVEPRDRTDAATKLITTMCDVLRVHKTLLRSIKGFIPQDVLHPEALRDQRTNSSPSRHASSLKNSIVLRARQALSNSSQPDVDPDDVKSFRHRLYLLMERPHSSRQAVYVNRFFLAMVILSMLLFYAETTPEFQVYGVSSQLCHRAVEAYCSMLGRSVQSDPGCFVHSSPNTTTTTRLAFHCDEAPDLADFSQCFGFAWNYGSNTSTIECRQSFVDVDKVCSLRQCQSGHEPIVDMTNKWIYVEVYFAIVFTAELLVRFFAARHRGVFMRSFGTWIDILAITPFYAETITGLVRGLRPFFTIVPTFPTFLTILPIAKTLRILKLARRLMIPLLFLFLGSVCAGAIFYEVQRGTQCQAHLPCLWWDRDIMKPSLAKPFPVGKRIQIQVDKLTLLTDMLRSTWMSIVTFTTVGYGDMKPRTPFGKILDILAMIFGSCYTAMPLSLIGGQFYACYAQFLKDSRATSPQTTAPVMDAMLHQQKRRRRRYPRAKISTADTPLLSQFVAMRHLLNEAILNTYRLKAMPAKVTPSATASVRSMDSMARSLGMQNPRLSATSVKSPDAVLANVLTACSLVQTIVLHFSIVIEKIVSIQDDAAADDDDMALQDVDDSRTRTDLLELQLPIKPTK
ncbi:unnamed protein product [Aphanomyces euteiches]